MNIPDDPQLQDALAQCDKTAILAACSRLGIAVPQDDARFWPTVHNARALAAASPSQRKNSERWLKAKGFVKPFILLLKGE